MHTYQPNTFSPGNITPAEEWGGEPQAISGWVRPAGFPGSRNQPKGSSILPS